jgi:hypothetical protein
VSHKQPSIESVFHAMVIIKTYCHYQDCDKCPFFQNGKELLSNNISGQKCFFETPDALKTNTYMVLCDYVEQKLYSHTIRVEDCFNKYKLAYRLLIDWKTNHPGKNYLQYEHHLESNRNKYNKKFLEWIVEE